MSRVKREQRVEFVCCGECGDDMTWMVEGHFQGDGSFMPADVDEFGGDAHCAECGERGEPIDPDVALADF